MEDTTRVRWTISVPKDTDVALRIYLAQTGLSRGDLSEFVVDAARWRLFDFNVTSARAKNAGVPAEQIEEALKEALDEVRAERFQKPG